MIHNPILPGFHPDPSIIRVGEDYYCATSTFEWLPGVVVHHSRDLQHWRCLGGILDEPRLVDLRGVGNSGGIWAPSLTHHDGRFWLVFGVVRTHRGPYKDVHNYLTSAPSIDGPWTDPIHLNSSGFDASLFHDDDGRSWLVNIQWDHRVGQFRFGGIVLQEVDLAAGRMIGPVTNILRKTELIEGPNLYRQDGWYYLMLAEGGTSWNHGVSMARARTITGPYELDPQPLVLTSRLDPGNPLQKAGHGELVATPQGEWFLAHLCSRPVYPDRRCVLGRETALQRVVWEGGWLRLATGGTSPQVAVAPPRGVEPHPWPPVPARDDFDQAPLDVRWSTLRHHPDASWLSLTERPGWLRLRGGESLCSHFRQSLVATPLTAVEGQATTVLDYTPGHYGQAAGLVVFYNTWLHAYLRVTHDAALGTVVGMVTFDNGTLVEHGAVVPVPAGAVLHLRATLAGGGLTFAVAVAGGAWTPVGVRWDLTRLSDDTSADGPFTGTMVGLCCQDLQGTGLAADFDAFAWVAAS